jgi:hypothetical protein
MFSRNRKHYSPWWPFIAMIASLAAIALPVGKR